MFKLNTLTAIALVTLSFGAHAMDLRSQRQEARLVRQAQRRLRIRPARRVAMNQRFQQAMVFAHLSRQELAEPVAQPKPLPTIARRILFPGAQ